MKNYLLPTPNTPDRHTKQLIFIFFMYAGAKHKHREVHRIPVCKIRSLPLYLYSWIIVENFKSALIIERFVERKVIIQMIKLIWFAHQMWGRFSFITFPKHQFILLLQSFSVKMCSTCEGLSLKMSKLYLHLKRLGVLLASVSSQSQSNSANTNMVRL